MSQADGYVSPHLRAKLAIILYSIQIIRPTNWSALQNSVNRILAHVRHGPSRTQDDYNALLASIQDAWNEIIVWENEGAHDTVLKTIFVLGNIVAGREWGMPLPAAGQDKEWLKKNLGIFLMRGQDYGEEEFLQLIDELKTREEFRAILE